METNHHPLGSNTFKHNQAGLVAFSLLIIGGNSIFGSSALFWFTLSGTLLAINFIWYSFSDVKWNQESFIIEKFLKKRVIASSEFIKVDRLFFSVFVIEFTTAKFYYVGDYNSVFENASDITNRIITSINKQT